MLVNICDATLEQEKFLKFVNKNEEEMAFTCLELGLKQTR